MRVYIKSIMIGNREVNKLYEIKWWNELFVDVAMVMMQFVSRNCSCKNQQRFNLSKTLSSYVIKWSTQKEFITLGESFQIYHQID